MGVHAKNVAVSGARLPLATRTRIIAPSILGDYRKLSASGAKLFGPPGAQFNTAYAGSLWVLPRSLVALCQPVTVVRVGSPHWGWSRPSLEGRRGRLACPRHETVTSSEADRRPRNSISTYYQNQSKIDSCAHKHMAESAAVPMTRPRGSFGASMPSSVVHVPSLEPRTHVDMSGIVGVEGDAVPWLLHNGLSGPPHHSPP